MVNKTSNRPPVALDISNKILMIFLLLQFAIMKPLGQFMSVSSLTREFLMQVGLNISSFPQHLAMLFPQAALTSCRGRLLQYSFNSSQRNPFAFMVRRMCWVGRNAIRCVKLQQLAELHIRAGVTRRRDGNVRSHRGIVQRKAPLMGAVKRPPASLKPASAGGTRCSMTKHEGCLCPFARGSRSAEHFTTGFISSAQGHGLQQRGKMNLFLTSNPYWELR